MTEIVPPYDEEAEAAVLGAVLNSPEAMETAIDKVVDPSLFYRFQHQVLYQGLKRAYEEMNPAEWDYSAAIDALRLQGKLDEVGGIVYLVDIASMKACQPGQIVRVCKKLTDLWRRRRLMDVGTSLRQAAGDYRMTAGEALEDAQAAFEAVSVHTTAEEDGFVPLEKVVVDVLDTAHEHAAAGRTIMGLDCGFKQINKMLSGFQDGEMIILAARPSMGKTALALSFAFNCARNSGRTSLIFSLEMSRQMLLVRMLSEHAQVDSRRIRSGALSEDEWESVAAYSSLLAGLPIMIDDSSGLTSHEAKARVRRAQRTFDVGLVVIDYIGLMNSGGGGGGGGDNRVAEVSAISRGCKALARSCKVPLLALSQLSRAIEGRPGSRPRLSDLRDSGSLEQDADTVMFIHHPPSEEEDTESVVELIIGKQRNGPIGSIQLGWNKPFARFEDYDTVAAFRKLGE